MEERSAVSRGGTLTTEERWRRIHGYDGKYRVSDQGRVCSTQQVIGDGGWMELKRRFLKSTCGSGGRHRVTLTHPDGGRRSVPVDELVLEAFGSPRFAPGLIPLHFDGNPANDERSNLMWSQSDRPIRVDRSATAMMDRLDFGPEQRELVKQLLTLGGMGRKKRRTSRPRPSVQGERNPRAKLTLQIVLEIDRALRSGESVKSVATRHRVSDWCIYSIQRGRTWRWATRRARCTDDAIDRTLSILWGKDG